MKRIGLIITAAGNSARFGGDKLGCSIDGVPMLERCLRLYAQEPLGARFCVRVVVMQSFRTEAAQLAQTLGYTVVYNDLPEEGMARSVRLGTEMMQKEQVDGAMYSVADQPYLKAETPQRLLDAFERAPDRIVAPCAEGHRGNPVVFPQDLLPLLAELEGDVGGSRVIRRNLERLQTVAVPREELTDIDTKAEVKK